MSRLTLVRPLFYWGYVLMLAGGALLCVIALVDTARYYGQEPLAFSLRRCIPAAVLLLLCVSHAAVLHRWGFVFLAVPVFLVSYFALGLVVHVAVDGMAKGFPPGVGQDVMRDYGLFSGAIFVVGCLSTAGVTFIRHRAAALFGPVKNNSGSR